MAAAAVRSRTGLAQQRRIPPPPPRPLALAPAPEPEPAWDVEVLEAEEPEAEVMPGWARGLPAQFQRCRAYLHSWVGLGEELFQLPGGFQVEDIYCPCGATRARVFDRHMRLLGTFYTWSDGYRMPQGEEYVPRSDFRAAYMSTRPARALTTAKRLDLSARYPQLVGTWL